MEKDIDQQGTVEVEITDITQDDEYNNNNNDNIPIIEEEEEVDQCFNDNNFQESDQFLNEINQLYSYSELNILKKSDLSNQFYANLFQFCSNYYPEILNQSKLQSNNNNNNSNNNNSRNSISSSSGSITLKPIIVKWNDLTIDIKNDYIIHSMEILECSFKGNNVLYQKYLTRLRFIWYIAQGVRDESDSVSQQIKYSKSNCTLLVDNHILPILLKSLILCSKISNEQIVSNRPIVSQQSQDTNTPLRKHGHHHHHHQVSSVAGNNSSKNNSLNIKINVKKSDPMMSIILDIIYLILINNQDNEKIQSDIIGIDVGDDIDNNSNSTSSTTDNIIQIMIQLLCEFNEIEGNVYPIKKILLVFHKSIQIYFGSLENLKRRKEDRLTKANYQHVFKSRTTDISNFIKTTSRYHHILMNNAKLHQVNSHYLGTPKEYKSYDLLHLPPSLSESLVLLQSHLYPPEPIRKEIGVNYYNNNINNNNNSNITKPRILLENPSNFERFYCMNVGNLSKIIIILLKIILAAAPIKSYTGPINLMAEIIIDTPSPGSSASLIETMQSAVDFLRHKEIVSKSTLGILLLLLKHSKFNQYLQFEYITKILYESNAIVLLYKCLNLESIEKHLYSQNFIASEEYFNITTPISVSSLSTYTNSSSSISSTQTTQTTTAIKENWRNYFSTICILRIIQKIIKHHPPRIYSLPLTKSANILKKYVQLDQLHQKPLIRYYGLKVMKSLIPYLNKKWKQNNMKIITDIYLYVPIHINDHWLTYQSQLSDHDQNIFESNIQEKIEEYHKANYELWYQHQHQHSKENYDIFYKTIIDGVVISSSSSLENNGSNEKIPVLLERGLYDEILDFDSINLSNEEKNRALSEQLDNLDEGESSIIYVQDSLEDNLLFDRWNIQKPSFSFK